MTNGKKTIGAAIDEIVAALQGLDELARATAVRAACEHLGVVPPQSASIPPSGGEPPPPAGGSNDFAPPPAPVVTDIRTFKEQKRPTSAKEMACVVAYYLESLSPPNERKTDVTTKDMEKYFKQAGFRLPTRIAQLLVDAKSSGYLDSAGHGKYRLNPVGHNLVVHSLPKSKES